MKSFNYFLLMLVVVTLHSLCVARPITFVNNAGVMLSIDAFVEHEPIKPFNHFVVGPQRSVAVDIDTTIYKSFIASDTEGKQVTKAFAPNLATYTITSGVHTSPAGAFPYLSAQGS